MKNYAPFYLAEFFLEWEVFEIEVAGEIKVVMFSGNSPPPENRAVYEIMWKDIVELNNPHNAT